MKSKEVTDEDLRDSLINIEQSLLDYFRFYATNFVQFLNQEQHDGLMDIIDKIFRLKMNIMSRISNTIK